MGQRALSQPEEPAIEQEPAWADPKEELYIQGYNPSFPHDYAIPHSSTPVER
jgi:hypothetical protein